MRTLYRYEERIALGTDPARFREEIPRWLDTGLRLVIEALKIRFEDIDFAPVEARARADLLPAVQAAAVNLHHACTAMFLEIRPLKLEPSLTSLARSEFWPAVSREFAAFGAKLPEDEAGLKALEADDKAAERVVEQIRANLVERLVSPLPEAQRAPVREALLAEEGLDDEFDLARERLGPSEEDLVAFAARGLGAYAVYGILDSFDIRFRLELPGKPLRTNGELARLPAVTWRIGKDSELLLVPPVLHACSFVPAKGVAPEGWDLATLGTIDEALRELEPDLRAQVAMVVAGGIGGTWDDAGLPGKGQAACRVVREAIEAAKSAAR